MGAFFNRESLVKNLPDAYRKTPDSNNAKILEIEKGEMDALREAIRAVLDSLELDHAAGATLDMYGDMLGQARGTATDEQYRILIRNRINRNFANADHTSIVMAIAQTFGCDPSEILLKEMEEPCHVMLEGLPIARLNAADIDISTAVQIVNGLIPVGVYMEAMNFAGTLEFSGTELVYDENAGLADEAQTIGGFFGLVSDGSGNNLPV